MSVQRSYSIHYRNSTKANTSLTNWPYKSLYDGVFLSGVEGKHYSNIFRGQGMSFPVEGVAGAKEFLAENVERAREVGDTLDVHAALLPVALLSAVVEDEASAGRAVVDVSRVTKSAAARHRSLRNLCQYILVIVESLAEWIQESRPVLRSDETSAIDDGSEGAGDREGSWNPKTRCRSLKDLVQTWTRTAHLLFWGWRCDVLRYLDEDRHSDVVVVKNKVRSWIDQVSSASRMGLRLPMLRWHGHGRTIADGKGAFLDATASVRRRLSSLRAWLHCLDLSLAWDAAKVCDRVHSLHQERQSKSGPVPPHGGWNLRNLQLSGGGGGGGQQARENAASSPTAAGLLRLQRGWLDGIVADAHVRDTEAAQGNKKRKARRGKKTSASTTAAAVDAAMAGGVRYVPAPAAPDSSRAPKGVDVRRAVAETLGEDVVPEAFAHELTLMKYAAENGLDKSLHDSLSDLLTSVLTPNPFPVLTDALAVSSTSLVLRRTVDSDADADTPPAPLKSIGSSGGDGGTRVFVARGREKDAKVYGSKPALAGVDVDTALSLFRALPPVAGWALDALGDGCDDVQVGILGCAQRHGSHAHHAVVPSDLTAMVACECDFDLDSGTTPMEHFARCAVRCATLAHKKSALLVVGLASRSAASLEEGDTASPPAAADGAAGGGRDRFLLARVLHEPEEVEDELAYLGPEEIVIEALVPYPAPGGREALVPMSIRLLLVTESGADGGGGGGGYNNSGEASAASMFYNCVYSTAAAAEGVAARLAALAEESPDIPQRHVKRTRRLVSETLDKGEYLEAYQLVHSLGRLRLAVPDDDDAENVSESPESEADSGQEEADEAASHGRIRKAPQRSQAVRSDTDAAATVALKRMARGPAGRLRHARRLLGVLHKVILKEGLAPEMLALLDGTAIRQHAEYCISYLLDTLAEQPVVRFEGAVQSIKLRARLLLDHIVEMTTEIEDLRQTTATRAAGADATRESACDLAGATISMLEIVQLAAESDTHRCCPEMDAVFEQFRGVDGTGQKPRRDVGRGGRRAAAAAPGRSSTKSAGDRTSDRPARVRFEEP